MKRRDIEDFTPRNDSSLLQLGGYHNEKKTPKAFISMAIGVLIAEIVNYLVFSNRWLEVMPREVYVGLVCDAILSFILKYITERYWSVKNAQDAVTLAAVVFVISTIVVLPCLPMTGFIMMFTVSISGQAFVSATCILLSMLYLHV